MVWPLLSPFIQQIFLAIMTIQGSSQVGINGSLGHVHIISIVDGSSFDSVSAVSKVHAFEGYPSNIRRRNSQCKSCDLEKSLWRNWERTGEANFPQQVESFAEVSTKSPLRGIIRKLLLAVMEESQAKGR